jgi:hypothetical protein
MTEGKALKGEEEVLEAIDVAVSSWDENVEEEEASFTAGAGADVVGGGTLQVIHYKCNDLHVFTKTSSTECVYVLDLLFIVRMICFGFLIYYQNDLCVSVCCGFIIY